jgi:hypothetical protein
MSEVVVLGVSVLLPILLVAVLFPPLKSPDIEEEVEPII